MNNLFLGLGIWVIAACAWALGYVLGRLLKKSEMEEVRAARRIRDNMAGRMIYRGDLREWLEVRAHLADVSEAALSRSYDPEAGCIHYQKGKKAVLRSLLESEFFKGKQ